MVPRKVFFGSYIKCANPKIFSFYNNILFALWKIQGWVIPLSTSLEKILLLILKLDFCLKMENKCCSYLTNWTERGGAKIIHSRWKVSQHFALEASLAATEIFQYWDSASSSGAGRECTKIQRNLNRSYLLQKEAFPINYRKEWDTQMTQRGMQNLVKL